MESSALPTATSAELMKKSSLKILPVRNGERPSTSVNGGHKQISDQASPALWGELMYQVFSRPEIYQGKTHTQCADSFALFYVDKILTRYPNCSLADQRDQLEPVHIHGVFDTSLHLILELNHARQVCKQGWGEPNPHCTNEQEIMVYGPRDEFEFQIVLELISDSLNYIYKLN